MTELSTIPISRLNNIELDTKIKTEIDKNGIDLSTIATNCITEIPQDIKLELNNGTLTLKAGSKVYVPNGVGVFDVKVFTQDVSISSLGTSTGKYLLSYGNSAWSSQECFDYFHVSQTNLFSGTSQPTTTTNNSMWYDTTNNVIKTTNDAGSTWTVTNNTFPICIVTSSSGTITSIDQVFNGFGYISSTVFALPGVKGLIPNGQNADGTLKNTEFTVDNVWLGQTAYNTDKATLGLNLDFKRVVYLTNNDVVYDKSDNKNKLVTNGGYWGGCFAGVVSVSNMKFTSLQSKTTFHALDYNDKSTIINWGMPDYTAGVDISSYVNVNNGSYTAPADCLIVASCQDNTIEYLSALGRYHYNEHEKFIIIADCVSGASFTAPAYISKGTTIYPSNAAINNGKVYMYPLKGVK